jgi:hypothetical protein
VSAADLESLFERAVVSQGAAYLLAESELRELPESASVLREHVDDADPVARLAASVMLEWNEGRDPGFAEVPRYLDDLEKSFGRTVAGVPPIEAVVENLTHRFGGAVAEFVALRLVQRVETDWRALVTLAYLDRHKNPATTAALIRFASETPEPRLQQLAAQVVAELGDPDLAEKIAAEGERLATHGMTLPPVVASLTAPPGQVA